LKPMARLNKDDQDAVNQHWLSKKFFSKPNEKFKFIHDYDNYHD
jgi:hypothetical protein